ncbi:MAG TPA: KpsF/GutQ family sugar-phosphate isomerase [Candidatus Sabulitectum sp.]|nr:KpsF/GutQ family sugar-phosphate isomerase [Candidatus Sabulitectum sp.]HPF31624.1 KpsF/GutQ family sugar-phosphate isomerase [Candidatus Sabulitectum sp.]HPJ28150.1 KpsF/GutQ family sugar-phosphate isomerase [Candidatus Sabulitectum sp.]HPR21816.1 KpsF/GutQ family sugar-phosphate isomerase [Candidatus Sabulitectum sp.]HRW77468.1 KpsF/GutQ family sugar-phosphate isomerase [Candidatus Sabulitectum sp.]
MNDVLNEARRVFRIEGEWLERTIALNGDSFPEAVNLLSGTEGKIVVCGMGKSGLVGRKIAATMTSTGNPAYFLHPAEGFHGDLGMLARGDTALVLSKSGDTDEIAALLPILGKLRIPVVAMVTSRTSLLGRFADVVLQLPDLPEACPFNLAPTASTTAMMALGDALSMAMLKLSGFTPEDFAEVHPGGNLGRRLLTRVSDMMISHDLPTLALETRVPDAVETMTGSRGICLAVNGGGKLAGVFVYGDLGRLMKSRASLEDLTLQQVMTPEPAVCSPDELVSLAVQRMEEKGITSIVAVDGEEIPVGILYLHDALVLGF